MKIITLCGSTKFRKEFESEQKRLTLEGNIVISVGLFGHETGLKMNGKTKKMLDKMHFKKIDMADEIHVINPGGYIGLSTCDEIHYTIANGKKVRFYEYVGICVDSFDNLIKDNMPCDCGCFDTHLTTTLQNHCSCLNYDTTSDEWICRDCGKVTSRYGGNRKPTYSRKSIYG